MVYVNRICSICNALIPKEWDNDAHYGTCPNCKKGAVFSLPVKTDKEWEKEEIDKKNKDSLLSTYNVIKTNEKSGMRHVNNMALAKLISNECGMHFLTIEDETSGKQILYYYKNGYYTPGGDNRIREKVQYFLDDLSSIQKKNEVVGAITNVGSNMRHELEPELNLINLKNGVYDINTDKILKHDPKYHFLNQIPIEYKKDADCPKIKKFFSQVVYPEFVPLIQEMFGYILYRKYTLHKAFMLYGGGRNGKGTTINLIQKFVGRDNYSSRSLIDILENRFAKGDLYCKLCNLAADISGKAIMDTGVFKNLTGGEPITGEHKHHAAFNFFNYAKLIFNANQIPYSKNDKTTAFFQRWIIIPFPKTFEMGDKKTDPDIFEKISTESEMSGLFNWAIEGLKRVLTKKEFSYYIPEGEKEQGEQYELLAKPDVRFIKEYLQIDSGNIIQTADVYNAYVEWAEARRYPIVTTTAFTRTIKWCMYDKPANIRCEVTPTHIAGKAARCYKNINWKDTPSNGFRMINKITDYEKKPLNDKLKELKEFVHDNERAKYSITLEFLCHKFKESFISQAIESGLLIKKPDETYTFN